MKRTIRNRVAKELRDKGYTTARIESFINALAEKNLPEKKIREVMRLVKNRASGPDEAFLSKHIDSSSLTIDDILEWVNLSDIASIQNVTAGIIRIINDPDATVKHIKELIEVDPPLSAKVLHLANSATFASRNKINDIEHAVMWIGFDNLKSIVLNQKVFELFKDDEQTLGYSRLMLWKHSVAVALFCKMLCRREFGRAGDNLYAAGLLHDLGILCEDQFLYDGFRKIVQHANQENESFHVLEKQHWGFAHPDIGGAICEAWSLPPDLHLCVRYHHAPLDAPDAYRDITCTLYLADHYCHSHGLSHGVNYIPNHQLAADCLGVLGVKEMATSHLASGVVQEIGKMEESGLFEL